MSIIRKKKSRLLILIIQTVQTDLVCTVYDPGARKMFETVFNCERKTVHSILTQIICLICKQYNDYYC